MLMCKSSFNLLMGRQVYFIDNVNKDFDIPRAILDVIDRFFGILRFVS